MTVGDSLVQALREIQARCGYLPRPELEALAARRPDFPLHRLHEVASFFPHFRLEPPGGLEVRVCRDMACHLAGAPRLRRALEAFAAELGLGKLAVGGASCLGRCDGAPAVRVGERTVELADEARCRAAVVAALATPDPDAHRLPADRPGPTGWRIDPYEGNEEYGAVRAFVADPNHEALADALKVADLRGMGGAGVRAHQKWDDVRRARGEVKYVVCNADESEPTTFKDRELLLRAPHLVLEGVILGALFVGAGSAYIYIRHEYEEQVEAVRAAIARAEALGVCGRDVLGTGRPLAVEVFVSPGGYICGEQSALVEAMEGKRAEPRNKPPLLETNGLFDRPTLLSNVETFAWVPAIALRGGAWYRDQGANGYKGLRFFSVCGDLNLPGVYEVPIGITLRELVDGFAGGMKGGRRLKAFAPSGPSGGFLPARLPRSTLPRGFEAKVPARFLDERLPEGADGLDVLDLELDLQLFRDLGLMLGAGMMVYDEGANMLEHALNASEFFRNESCGKCVPCRLGSHEDRRAGLGDRRPRARRRNSAGRRGAARRAAAGDGADLDLRPRHGGGEPRRQRLPLLPRRPERLPPRRRRRGPLSVVWMMTESL
jgi:NADH:ubiquinone oxidoreductase subunit F (NADH-binding)/NADH:ubiquinone oxidoreductase subunit E